MKKNYVFLTLAALFLAACTAGPDGGASVDSDSGAYSISLDYDKTVASAYTSRNNANEKAPITLTVVLPEVILSEDSVGGGGGETDSESESELESDADPVPQFVDRVIGTYITEDGAKKNFTLKPSASTKDEWTFNMPGGDVTIKITFTDTPNPTNAFLQDLSSPAGLISPSFARTTLAYTINVPFNTKEFSIDAQAENPYLRPVLKRKDIALPENLSDGLLGENLIAPDDGTPPAYCLDGASAEYEITVTPEEGDPLKYTVTVNLLPDLSLAELKVTYNDSSGKVVRKLAPWMEEQTVYIPATTAVLEASPSSPDAAIDKPTQNVTGINADGKSATVTVSNQNLGKSSSYTVKLIYDGNLKPMASGGFINFIRDGVDYYETHTFTEAGTLSFNNGSTTSINADILLVGGGGGAGGGADRGGKPRAKNTDFPGGGGAGALLYKTGYTLALTSGSVQVSAGGGGAGGNTNKPGDNGQDSWIGVDSSSKTLVAPGGGGGGGSGMSGNGGGISGDAGTIMPGRDGGSGGGGGNGVGNDWGPGGQSTPTERDFLGNSGGNGQSDKGGGGGGAKGAGVNGGAGGAAWKAADESAAWIQGLTGTNEFSRGGQGGLGHLTPADGANFGDGGCAGKSETIGGSGHGGIVVIRFKYTAPTQ